MRLTRTRSKRAAMGEDRTSDDGFMSEVEDMNLDGDIIITGYDTSTSNASASSSMSTLLKTHASTATSYASTSSYLSSSPPAFEFSLSLPSPEKCWEAVLARDRLYDTIFVYTVRSTRIFCRPTCPARRPLRAGVDFFPTKELAIKAGFRACKRCKPEEQSDPTERRQKASVEKAKSCIRSRVEAGEKFNLDDLANDVGVSAFHLHRTFKKLAHVTPDAYARQVRKELGLKGARMVTRTTARRKSDRAKETVVSYSSESDEDPSVTAMRMVHGALQELDNLAVIDPSLI